MLRITLVCSNGMSTSMLVDKMKAAAVRRGIDVDIDAVADDRIKDRIAQTDVLLLGPQVRYLQKNLKAQYEGKGIVVDTIEMTDYGRMNGENVLDAAIRLNEKRGASL